MRAWRGAFVGVCKIRGAVLVSLVSLSLLCFWCADALAGLLSFQPVKPFVPLVRVEEFVPGASSVSADFYAFMVNEQPETTRQPTTSTLQYVDATDYAPGAADPYAAGVTVAFGASPNSQTELHARLALMPNQVYHYRVLASNAEGSVETPDQTFQTYPPSEGVLPDGRAYEQVSPIAKNGLDALGSGEHMAMQASPSSSAPAFAFFSVEPFPVAAGTAVLYTEYLSTRLFSPAAAWTTKGVQAPTQPLDGQANEASGFTEDLAKTIVTVTGPPLSPSGITNAYVRDNASGVYQLLAPNVSTTPLLFADATRDDSRIVFETYQQLLPAAAASVDNLYEWDENRPEGERLSLVGVLTDAECAALSRPSGCAPPNGSGAGADGGGELQGFLAQRYSQNTISEDGSKVIFTAHPSGRIYERRPLEPSPVTVPVSAGQAKLLAAIPSGRYVFYTEGTELYRFDTASETRQALSSGAEGVRGSLGVSDDGSYAYFVANGVLAANQNASGEPATKGAPNLYEWHEDTSTQTSTTTFVARLLPGDEDDWQPTTDTERSGQEGRTSRLNPGGTALLFMSGASLTGYDNSSNPELFLYDATAPLSTANPICVSCNPSGVGATAPAHLAEGGMRGASISGPYWRPHFTRNLSAGGDRVFFETMEALVPGDTNNVSDVYEWEREGVGSCPSGGEGHCLYLISSGTAHAKSFFGDASASGEDVFFFTRQPLVGQDTDVNFDVYDARVGGGIPAQNPSVTRCEGEECKPPPSPTPVFEAPGSNTLTGLGQLGLIPPYKAIKCAKGRKLSHGKCVMVKCAKGRKLSHGKCVKVNNRKKAKARKAAGSVGRRGK